MIKLRRVRRRVAAVVQSRVCSALFVLAMLLAAALVFNPWRSVDSTASKAQAQWIEVQPQLVEVRLGLVGRIQAARQETLAAPFEGIVREVLVQEGQTVEPGQPLVRIAPDDIDIQLRRTLAELLKIQREVQRMTAWDSSPDVARARRAVQSVRSTLETTEANLRDTRQLFERGIVARMEVDALAQQLRSQQQDLVNLQDEARQVEARGVGEEPMIAEMELVNAQARYQALLAQKERQVIRAPFRGVIARPSAAEGSRAVLTQAGTQVARGSPLLAVIGLDRVQVLTRVEETDLQRLSEGMTVEITGEGFSGEVIAGRIATLALQGDVPDAPGAAAHYDVVISVDAHQQATSQVRLGMSARLAIQLYRREDSIVVPPEALRTDEQGKFYVLFRATPDSDSMKTVVTPGHTIVRGVEAHGLGAGYVLVSQN